MTLQSHQLPIYELYLSSGWDAAAAYEAAARVTLESPAQQTTFDSWSPLPDPEPSSDPVPADEVPATRTAEQQLTHSSDHEGFDFTSVPSDYNSYDDPDPSYWAAFTQGFGGTSMALPILVGAGLPVLARVIPLIGAAKAAGPVASNPMLRFLGGATKWAGLGYLFEQVGDALGFDDPEEEDFARMIANDLDSMVASGLIDTPATRRDGTESPWNYLTFNLNLKPGQKGWGFVHPEHISRKFVRTVRARALTPATRVSSAPRRRRR